MNGVDALIAIRNEFPDAKIAVLTTYVGDVQIIRAIKAGAQAYLLKNCVSQGTLADDSWGTRREEGLFPGGLV